MVGSTLPSHCTSMGRVLLAAADAEERETWLEQEVLERRTDRTIVDAPDLRDEIGAVGEQRWSLVEAEREPGLRTTAGRVRSRTGPVVAAPNGGAGRGTGEEGGGK